MPRPGLAGADERWVLIARRSRRPGLFGPVRLLVALAVLTGFITVGAVSAHATSPGVSTRFGVAVPGAPYDLSALHQVSSSLGVVPGTTMWYEQWSSAASFPAAQATAVNRLGSEPEITWEPWNPADGTVQPRYSLASIASGAHDPYLRRWAKGIREWGLPLKLRFAQEMNGDWYPWSQGVNGNKAGSFVAAWRHVHAVFASADVHNVSWIWSPNVIYPGSTPLAQLWPGDSEVNAVALDGYNWGKTSTTQWQSFAQIFSASLASLKTITSRPVFIGEVGSSDLGGDKAEWIKEMFATLAGSTSVRGFTWFDFDKERDWRINSSPASLAAFRHGIAGY